jgi:uncharacterized YigZ family protein
MLTIHNEATVETVIKRSRFLAHARRVDSLGDTLDFFESVADHSASHNCWAWKLDHQYRFNDDGEPSGTAGKPIFTAIDGKKVDHVMVVVTRWFGGIKLGVGGLVRAYGGISGKCIDQAGLTEVVESREYRIDANFSWTGQVHAALEHCGAEKINESFNATGLSITISLDIEKARKLKAILRDSTRGEVGILPV